MPLARLPDVASLVGRLDKLELVTAMRAVGLHGPAAFDYEPQAMAFAFGYLLAGSPDREHLDKLADHLMAAERKMRGTGQDAAEAIAERTLSPADQAAARAAGVSLAAFARQKWSQS